VARLKVMKPTAADLLAAWKADPLSFYRDQIYLEDGQRFGDAADAWQMEDLAAIETHRNTVKLAPRAHDKTGSAGSVIVKHLVLSPPGFRIFSVAADQDQALLLKEDATAKLKRNSLLRGLFKETVTTITMRATGNRYEALASDAPSAYGLRADLLICDEMSEWPTRSEKLWFALWSGMGKRPNSKTIIISTPGGDLLQRVLTMAKGESDWAVIERGACASWISEAWRQQQKRGLPLHVFERLHLGRWVEGQGLFLSREEVRAVFQAWTGHVVAWAIGVDLAITRDRAVVAVLGLTVDGLVVVEHLLLWTPTSTSRVPLEEVEATVADLAQQLRPVIVADPYQAVLMCARWRAQGFDVIEYGFTSDGRKKLFARLLDTIRTQQLRSHPHDIFEQELLGLQIEQQGAGWRVDHQPGAHDDCVIAVGLGLAGLATLHAGDDGAMSPEEMRQLQAFTRSYGGYIPYDEIVDDETADGDWRIITDPYGPDGRLF
jgi:hypothetical protein